MTSEKFKFERSVEDAVKNICEWTQLALKESQYGHDEIAGRMNMGNPALVKAVLENGNVEHMQMGTLIRLIHACGFEMHVKFVAPVVVPPPGMDFDDEQ